jgi:hypothetical protein
MGILWPITINPIIKIEDKEYTYKELLENDMKANPNAELVSHLDTNWSCTKTLCDKNGQMVSEIIIYYHYNDDGQYVREYVMMYWPD